MPRDVLLLVVGGLIGLVSSCVGVVLSHVLQMIRQKQTWEHEDRKRQEDVMLANAEKGRDLLERNHRLKLGHAIRTHGDIVAGDQIVGGCFPRGTPVTCSDGSQRPIEELAPGDELLSYDLDRRTLTTARVKEKIEQQAREYVAINNGLTVTPDHFVFTVDDFRPVRDLRVGDQLLTQSLTTEEVWSIEKRQGYFVVFTCYTVDDLPFFAKGVLVDTSEGKVPLATLKRRTSEAQQSAAHGPGTAGAEPGQ